MGNFDVLLWLERVGSVSGAWQETAKDFVHRNSTKSPVGKESNNNKTLPYFDAGLILNITLGEGESDESDEQLVKSKWNPDTPKPGSCR